jgi:Domain of unknown function (DUF4349)
MRALVILSALLLVSCGEKGMVSASNESAGAAPVEALMVKEEAAPGQADAAAPQIAYRYSRRYRTPTDGIAALQDRHVALCEQAGKGACHVLSQRIAEAATGQDSELTLSVTASKAGTLLLGLDKAVEGNGGDVVASGTEAEDLGTRIVDVEARLRAKQALVDRLLVIIRSRTGGIKDVVAAEQAFAEAQGDLEAAQAELSLMRRQVARSTITLNYAAPAGARSSFNETLRPTFDEAGTLLGESLASLVRAVIVSMPWLIGIGLPVRWWWRRRQTRKAASDMPPHDASVS